VTHHPNDDDDDDDDDDNDDEDWVLLVSVDSNHFTSSLEASYGVLLQISTQDTLTPTHSPDSCFQVEICKIPTDTR